MINTSFRLILIVILSLGVLFCSISSWVILSDPAIKAIMDAKRRVGFDFIVNEVSVKTNSIEVFMVEGNPVSGGHVFLLYNEDGGFVKIEGGK